MGEKAIFSTSLFCNNNTKYAQGRQTHNAKMQQFECISELAVPNWTTSRIIDNWQSSLLSNMNKRMVSHGWLKWYTSLNIISKYLFPACCFIDIQKHSSFRAFEMSSKINVLESTEKSWLDLKIMKINKYNNGFKLYSPIGAPAASEVWSLMPWWARGLKWVPSARERLPEDRDELCWWETVARFASYGHYQNIKRPSLSPSRTSHCEIAIKRLCSISINKTFGSLCCWQRITVWDYAKNHWCFLGKVLNLFVYKALLIFWSAFLFHSDLIKCSRMGFIRFA